MTRPVRWPFIIAFTLALLGAWMAIMTPATVTLALRVAAIDPLGKEESYSWVAGVGALFALGANPIFGALSDRTTSSFGMRRPWILLGACGGCIGAAIIASANTLTMIAVGWAVMQTLCNASLATLVAVIGDRVPDSQRGLISGIAGTTMTGGILAGSYLTTILSPDPWLLLMVPALASLLFSLIFALCFKDRVLDQGLRSQSREYWIDSLRSGLAKRPRFLWCLLTLFLASSGIAVFQTYVVFFLSDTLSISEKATTQSAFFVLAACNVAATVASPFAGALTDYWKRRDRVFAAGVLLMAIGLAVMIATRKVAGICLGGGILGVGYGVFSGLYAAMVLDTVPSDSSVARDLGFGNIAITAPYFAIPAVAPIFLSLGRGRNYTALYLVGIVLTLTSIPIIKKATAS